MTNLFTVLGLLFIALLIMVTLVERFGKPASPQKLASLSRWILPLVLALLVMQLVSRYLF